MKCLKITWMTKYHIQLITETLVPPDAVMVLCEGVVEEET